MRTPGAERRVAVLLAADDASGERERRARLAALVAARGGRLASPEGEPVLAEFATARAALECAADVQRELALYNAALPEAAIACRIGVHAGELRADPLGIYGEAVDAARALERACAPGGVLASAAAHAGAPALPGFVEREGRFALEPPAPAAAPSRKRFVGAALVLAAVAATALAPEIARRLEPPRPPTVASLAVLPFPESDDIAAALERLPNIELQADPRKARYVLRGRVERSGDDVVIQVEVAEASRDTLVWGERYLAAEEELPWLREHIARAVALALK